MNRSSFFVGGLAAVMFVVLLLFVGIIKQSAAGTPSPSAAANHTITPAPDAASMAIDDLAAWPVAGTRK